MAHFLVYEAFGGVFPKIREDTCSVCLPRKGSNIWTSSILALLHALGFWDAGRVTRDPQLQWWEIGWILWRNRAIPFIFPSPIPSLPTFPPAPPVPPPPFLPLLFPLFPALFPSLLLSYPLLLLLFLLTSFSYSPISTSSALLSPPPPFLPFPIPPPPLLSLPPPSLPLSITVLQYYDKNPRLSGLDIKHSHRITCFEY